MYDVSGQALVQPQHQHAVFTEKTSSINKGGTLGFVPNTHRTLSQIHTIQLCCRAHTPRGIFTDSLLTLPAAALLRPLLTHSPTSVCRFARRLFAGPPSTAAYQHWLGSILAVKLTLSARCHSLSIFEPTLPLPVAPGNRVSHALTGSAATSKQASVAAARAASTAAAAGPLEM